MPDASGRFKGQGWSRAKEDSWTRIFGPALADDPAYEALELVCTCGSWTGSDWNDAIKHIRDGGFHEVTIDKGVD